MGTLKQDIKKQSHWIVIAFAEDGFKLDYTIDSLIEVDRFFIKNMKNGKPITDSRLTKRKFGTILFSIGSYVGEVLIKNVKGSEWITDDNDPQGELNVSLKLPNGEEIWPIQKVMKRFQSGSEDAIYPYAHVVIQEYTRQPFNEKYWVITLENNEPDKAKPWWKFW